MTGETDQRHIRGLHERALFSGVSPGVALIYLRQALHGYDNPFDKARAARDLGKLEFREGNLNWSSYLDQSLGLLDEALLGSSHSSDRENMVLREQAATNGMYGRLALAMALRMGNDVTYPNALEFFETAKQKLGELSGGSLLPDQYEVNFAAAHAVAERYGYGRRKALRPLGRAALIAPLSESDFARHHREGISYTESFRAKRRAVGRAAFATKLVLRGDKYINREDVRLKAAAMIA